jgi:hypothetical protein
MLSRNQIFLASSLTSQAMLFSSFPAVCKFAPFAFLTVMVTVVYEGGIRETRQENTKKRTKTPTFAATSPR